MAAKTDNSAVSRTKTRLVTFALMFGVALVYSAYDILISYPDTPHNGSGETVSFTVKKGIGPAGLTDDLKQAKLISSPGKFSLWLKLTGEFADVKAGEFNLTTQMTPTELIAALQGKGNYKGVRITIPEGFKLSQIAAALEVAGLVDTTTFRAACFNKELLQRLGIPGASAEGFLFPDTYFFNQGVTAEEVITKMHRQFVQKTAELNLPTGARLHSLITLASIVQAEAKVIEEAPIIAGVYTNRLIPEKFPSGRLQADPTVSYGCDPFVPKRPASCATFKGVLGSKQLTDTQNRYNTYKHAGLPPGPICAPGLPAIRAALKPKAVPYLYFVVSQGGKHRFSATLADHQQAVEAYRQSRGK